MNSLRIESVNGHLFTRVFFSFPLFAYCTLFSYVFFLRLARIRADQYESLPQKRLAVGQDSATTNGLPFPAARVFVAAMGECSVICRCSKRPMKPNL